MFFRKPTYHRFEYEPRFYKPDADPAEQLKRRMRAQRRSRRPRRRLVLIAAVLFLIIYFYLFLSGALR